MKNLPLYAMFLLLAGVASVQTCRLDAAKVRAGQLALRADSLEAAADTTHALNLRILGDTMSAFQRRVIQERQRADDLDKALKLERIARVAARLEVSELRAALSAPVTELEGVRSGTFSLREEPYTIAATATLPPPPSQGTLGVSITLDPLTMRLRLSCGPTNTDGIRPALVTMFTPRWATVVLDSVSQAPELCRSPALQPQPKRRWPWLVAGLLAGVIGWEVIR